MYNIFSSSPDCWKILKETADVSIQCYNAIAISAMRSLTKNKLELVQSLTRINVDLNLPAEAFTDAENLKKLLS